MPVGVEVTVPVPVPALTTVSACVVTENVAVTIFATSAVTVHVPVPLQPAPFQPSNAEPVAGSAVSVTIVPGVNW